MKAILNLISIKFVIIKLLILMIGIGLMYLLNNYGDVDVIYMDIFKPSLIFCMAYALFYTKEVHLNNWIFVALILCLLVYFVGFKMMTINNMKFYLTGQFLCVMTIMLFAYQVYRLYKYYKACKAEEEEEEN